ncbi:NUDIX hydrolase domain-like protein [Poronia punctata]|nr:NUDIX hydrolase domain-like protein [Poronia punctata]
MSTIVINGDIGASISTEESHDNLDQGAGSASSPLSGLETVQVPRDTNGNHADVTSPDSADGALELDIPDHELPSEPQNSGTSNGTENEVTNYWDASEMAPLNAVSAAAIARLRAYKPPPFLAWDRLPLTRRAAVLILLFADRRGDLRVVITMRAASLRNFSGHAAFPGGKADTLEETPYQIARREAWEEIGLPMDDSKIPRPFRIEHLCSLPCSLAKTELVARPCVAFLHADVKDGSSEPTPTADEAMIPRLDAKEVAAVFTAPFANFLRSTDEEPQPGDPPLPPGHWYDGRWIKWQEDPWRVHNFHVPVHNQRVTRPQTRAKLRDPLEDDDDDAVQRLLVWGMTGRILVDAARIAYGRDPEFEHNANFGDEKIIAELEDNGKGRLATEKKRNNDVGVDATKEEVKDAKM